jgi:hypothetical protein
MIIEVGNIIKSYLQPLEAPAGFIDKLAGVVKVITKVDVDENNKSIAKKFPVACDVTYADCMAQGKYKDLIPDSSVGCIVFLEDQGLRFNGMRGHKQTWKGSYKLIGWVNNKKLGYEECSVTGMIVASIINQFPVAPFNSGNYQSASIQVIGQEPKNGQNPFSKYSFDEAQTQYLMYPFDYFSLFIDVNFEIDKRCLTPFVKSASIPC